MDFEQDLKRVAEIYKAQGYQVVVRPSPADLPPFAKDFTVEIIARRGDDGVLVSVKKNREEMAADADMPRYAEITSGQPRWRFDFVILQAESQLAREVRGAQEPSVEHITQMLDSADHLAATAFLNAGLLMAWAGMEAAMRRRLRAAGETVRWGTLPQEMLNQLYSAGLFSRGEFDRLQLASRLRNEIIHGFAVQDFDTGIVPFLIETARRLLLESQIEN